VGFTQLYATYCSVDATPIWVLYDLFVDDSARRLGAGKALMDRALEHAKQSGASRIDLETEINNVGAQRLYESLGYVRETDFYKYCLEL
jgi:ribosomal protein S18 acetylase RimI-like enzyme